jgi:hypothetical protein
VKVPSPTEDEQRCLLELKYNVTAWFYDILDYPWERQYRHWRPQLVGDLRGEVLEAGVVPVWYQSVIGKTPRRKLLQAVLYKKSG